MPCYAIVIAWSCFFVVQENAPDSKNCETLQVIIWSTVGAGGFPFAVDSPVGKWTKSPTQQIYISASHCWWLHGPQYPYCYPCCWQLNPNHYRSKTPSVINSYGNFQATNGSFFWYMIYNDGIMEPGSSGEAFAQVLDGPVCAVLGGAKVCCGEGW